MMDSRREQGKIRQILHRYPRLSTFFQVFPAGFWIVVFFFLPLGIILLYSFWVRTVGGDMAPDFTWKNYLRFFQSALYRKISLQSFFIALKVTLVTLLIGYPPAYFLARLRPRWQKFGLILLVIPWWTSFVVKTFAWVVVLGRTGIINAYLLQWGLVETPLDMLYTQGAVIMGLTHGLLPLMVLTLYVSLEKIDPHLLEAAENLGANRVKTFFEVTFPLSLPGVTAGSLLVFILAFGAYLTPALLGGPRDLMIAMLIGDQFLEALHFPFGSAASIVMLIFVLGLVLLFNRLVGLEKIWGEGGR
jgi:spermidine/putrescine transport system permease protein